MTTVMLSSKPNAIGIACALFILVLFNSLLLAFGLHTRSFWLPGPAIAGVQPIMADSVGSGMTAAVTLNNELVEIAQGRVLRKASLSETINTMAVSPDGSKIYVGTSAGDVFVYNPSLVSQGTMHVPGNVGAIAVLPDGEVAVSYEQGQYTGLDFIAILQNGHTVASRQIDVAINALIPSGNGVLFGTGDSNVGFLDASGKVLWQTLLNQPIQCLYQAPSGEIYAGDNSGTLYALSSAGKSLWNHSISSYGLQTVKRVGGLLLAGDQNGNVIVANSAGVVLHSQPAFPSNSVVPNLLNQGNHSLLLMSNAGQAGSLDLAAAAGSDTGTLALEVADGVVSAACLALAGLWTPRIRRYVGLRWREIKRSGPAYALIWPAVILIAVFNVVPVLMAVFFSLTNYSLQAPLQFAGLSNYVNMWSDMFFTVGMWHIVLILVTSVAKELIFPLLVAELIFWFTNDKIKYWFRTAFVLPSVVPSIVGILLWKQMYNPEAGLINSFLGAVGLSHLENQWLGNPHTALWSVIFAGFPYVDIFGFLVYYGGLIGISGDIFDAASVDGVKWWGRFWKIELPSIKPQIRLIMFFTIVGSIQTFTNIYVFTNGGPGTATSVPGLEMYNQISDGFFGLSSGMGVILALMVLVVTFINFRVNRQEEV